MELITITISKETYDLLLDSNAIPDHKLKEVYVKDDMFVGDEVHKRLSDLSIKAYKALREYEFKKRHNIK